MTDEKDNERLVADVWNAFWEKVKGDREISPYSRYFFGSHLKIFRKYMDFKGRKILEVGVGGGVLALEIAKEGGEMIGLDISQNALEITKHRFSKTDLNCTLVKGTALSLPFKTSSIDMVYCLGLIEHFPTRSEKEKVLTELVRVTKKDGVLIVSVPKKYSIYTPKKLIDKLMGKWQFGYEEEFTIKEFKNLVEPFFHTYDIVGIDIHPSLYRYLPSVGPIRLIDQKMIVPAVEWLEKNILSLHCI